MCGRTACTLAPGVLRKACSYRDKNTGRYHQPEWQETGCEYKPSYNMCPTDVAPVLVSGSQGSSEESRVLVPMVWGLIPPWHKGGATGHRLTTHNCRLEGISSSKLYTPSLSNGRRCVMVFDGFYEWQTTKGDKNKQPYFIYMKQPEGVNILDDSKDAWSEENGWSGRSLMYVAAIYSTTHSPEGQVIYSCSMVTRDCSPQYAWLHDRMPCILETDQQIQDWLDSERVPSDKALTLLKPATCLSWHKVATLVNNSRCKDVQCNKPLSESHAANPLMKWLQKSPSLKRPVVAKNEEDVSKTQESVKGAERSAKKTKTESEEQIKSECDKGITTETDKDTETLSGKKQRTKSGSKVKTESEEQSKTESDKEIRTESGKKLRSREIKT